MIWIVGWAFLALQEKSEYRFDEKADAPKQISAALLRAAKKNRRVLLHWGSNESAGAVKLNALFREDAELRRTILYEYDLVLVEASRNGEAARKYGIEISRDKIPLLSILSAEGKVLACESPASPDARSLGAFLQKYRTEPWKAKDVLEKGRREAAEARKRIFLVFGAPW